MERLGNTLKRTWMIRRELLSGAAARTGKFRYNENNKKNI